MAEIYLRQIYGVISSLRHAQPPPFEPAGISSYLDLTEHMAYAFISSYLLNTGLYVAWANNELRINVTYDRAPEEVKKYLAMSCPADGEMCVGSLYPGIAARYPDAVAQVNIQASRSPQIHFQDGMISLDAGVDVDVYSTQNGRSPFLVGAQISVWAQLSVRIEDRKVMFNVSQIVPRGQVKRTSNHNEATSAFLQRMLNLGTDRYLVPFISKIGTKGIELPDIDKVRLQNPVVLIPYDEDGVMIIGVDLFYEGNI